jgi:hypothetical protein
VWQRAVPVLPLDVVVATGDPPDDEPLVTGAAEDDDAGTPALVVLGEDVLVPFAPVTEPWNEQPAMATSASVGRSSLEYLTAPTLEMPCDREPVVPFPFRDVVRRIGHRGEGHP